MLGQAGVPPTDIVLTDTHILVGNSSNLAADVAMSGDATISDTGVVTVASSGGHVFGTAAFTAASAYDVAGAAAAAVAAIPDTSSTVFGLAKVDGTTITAAAGVISAAAGATGANPTATAGPAAVNGSAATFMRSDGAPAVQKASAAQFGIVEVDGTTITAAAGVISAVGGATGANPTATAGPAAVNGSAATFMRSDGAPAIQKATAAQFGIVEVDGTTIISTGGIISAVVAGLPPGDIVLPNGDILVGNVSNVAAAVAMSGDATISNAGVVSIPRAGAATFGLVEVDNTTITSAAGVISAAAATSSTPGVVQIDNISIHISGGKIATGIKHPGFAAGRYYWSFGLAPGGTGTGFVANKIYASAFYVPFPTVFTKASVYCTALSAMLKWGFTISPMASRLRLLRISVVSPWYPAQQKLPG